MTSAAVAAFSAADLRFVLEYRACDGVRRRDVVQACCGERFEDALPVRRFRFAKGLRSFAGWWYFGRRTAASRRPRSSGSAVT